MSPRLVVNAATGAVAQEMAYGPFGEVLVDTSPGWQPFGFAGGLLDNDTTLVRFGARDYDAASGRWLSKDLFRFGGGDLNLYAYALNNPMSVIDPSGNAAAVIEIALEIVAVCILAGVAGYGLCKLKKQSACAQYEQTCLEKSGLGGDVPPIVIGEDGPVGNQFNPKEVECHLRYSECMASPGCPPPAPAICGLDNGFGLPL